MIRALRAIYPRTQVQHGQSSNILTVLALSFVLLWVGVASAQTPLRDASRLWDPRQETVVKLAAARVVLADYDLLRQDFLRLTTLSEPQIDQWLVDNAGFISKAQTEQTAVNTEIPVTSETRTAFRPREYRRAHVFVADGGGLIDVKGSGSIDPSQASHENGLATLGEMIREFAFEKLVRSLFARDGGQFHTVKNYAVLDFGFDVIHNDGSRSRAGAVLRQAHVRFHEGVVGYVRNTRVQAEMLPENFQLQVEHTLRKYGVTSAGANRYTQYDVINIQGSEDLGVVDFGAFLVWTGPFTRDISFFYDQDGNPKWSTAEAVGASSFVQPNKNLRVRPRNWGVQSDSKRDEPYLAAHSLAAQFAQGEIGRADIEAYVKQLLSSRNVPSLAPRKYRSSPVRGTAVRCEQLLAF